MPRDFPRSRRIEDQIQRILSDLIRTQIRDPRLANVIITAVKISKDLGVAWVYYTVLQAEGETENLDDAFASATGFLRSRLGKDLTVRRIPELRFQLDSTESYARDMDELIEAAVLKEHPVGEDADEPSDDSSDQSDTDE
ncbi:MAG: 30S ribosome-binding factor RbfA [Gammaproteobacteria bacterium]|nr:30S ribosome-binding factor RbfA [Gammaproteobacteria bacterium]MCP4090027.1 30S ribosome-binding factor RbfA [Gammaproteobacteria bacterium]MCP4277754.1 30S ribosome-binding factor RbfA [Gammaproteobacteria bacterium]MCP4832217.1 30S ribosome-binding factor RbfA [Gammaproteobacteria bacterium]MCP4929284.1 30S ribosome-binding factor RbfA [Gammaproteobacteria bacterium]